MRLLLVVNPAAAAVTTNKRDAVLETLAADHDVTVAETGGPGDATGMARDAAADGFDAVVVLSGDGTQNEAANGLVGTSTALGVLPGGSTNVLARTIGLPTDVVEAGRRLAAALDRGSRRRVGLGQANDRHFLFNAGLGFDAAVVGRVERLPSAAKRYAGHTLFAACAVATWFGSYDRSRPRFTVRLGADEVVEDGYFALCLKTNPYTFVGPRPLNVAPEAGFDRGLAMVVFRKFDLATLVGATVSALGSGEQLRRSRNLVYRFDLDEIGVTGHGPFPYQVDGEYLGEVDAVELRHRPNCLDLVVV